MLSYSNLCAVNPPPRLNPVATLFLATVMGVMGTHDVQPVRPVNREATSPPQLPGEGETPCLLWPSDQYPCLTADFGGVLVRSTPNLRALILLRP